MCNPAAIFAGQAVLQLGGALFTSSQQNNQQMDAYNRKVEAANAEADAINKSTVFNYAMDGLQEQQIQNKATIAEGQAETKLAGAVGEATGAAASSGVSGNSVQALFRSYAVATGKDIMGIRAQAQGDIGQAEADKQARQISAKNQILALKEGLPSQPNPVANTLTSMFGAALGVGKDFMADTTKVDPSKASGGLFGNGGILGLGRDFG